MHKFYKQIVLLGFIFLFAATSATFKKNQVKLSTLSIVTNGDTITLASTSANDIWLFGDSAMTVKLPNATTMDLGQWFILKNAANTPVTLSYNDGTSLQEIAAGNSMRVSLHDDTTQNGVWSAQYILTSAAAAASTAPDICAARSSSASVLQAEWNNCIDSITDNATGDTTFNFTSSYFSRPPSCTCTSSRGGDQGDANCTKDFDTSSASSYRVQADIAGTDTDLEVTIVCVEDDSSI